MAENGATKEKGLKDYGIIYLSGPIDNSVSERVGMEIIELNLSGKVEHIQMIINSPGGSCSGGFALIDLMEWSRIPIYTVGVGLIASMGLLVFMTGWKGRRIITPRTSILSHRFWTMSIGNHSQLLASRKEQDLEHERILDHYLRYSNLETKEDLEKNLLRDVDTWLTPEEAIQFGLADAVEPIRPKERR